MTTNILFLFSDEHARDALGCYGNSFVRTPHLDQLASCGVCFGNAYTNSPICVPARASLATGRYVHEIGTWDSAHPYEGRPKGWAHRLTEAGHNVTSIGKLHYRDTNSPNGFSQEILPMHVYQGIGWTRGLLRKKPPVYTSCKPFAEDVGPGESTYTEYDRNVTEAACHWLRNDAPKHREKPWLLFVSFVSPHYPLLAPRQYYDLYPLDDVPWPREYALDQRPTHPVTRAMAKSLNYDDYFDEERVRIARAGYYGLCSFLDDNIGKVLATLDACGLMKQTRIIYSSDHGECLGNRGLWAKSFMYEDSVGVPLLMAGPGVPKGKTVSTPVSLVDCSQTITDCVGIELTTDEWDLPGDSLLSIADGGSDRVVFSEYHDGGSITGIFMIRTQNWKYVHYVGYPPQLFDLDNDPYETTDLGESSAYADIRSSCEAKLREIVDPETVNAQAFRDQQAMIEKLGGEAAVLASEDFGHTPLAKAGVGMS